MRTVSEHQKAVAELILPVLGGLGTESVPLAAALHRVLAEDLSAPIAVPPFDNSQMDGYAVRAADSGARLPTRAAIAAGWQAGPLPAGWTVPIMTGAMVPAGADAVVPVEAASPDLFVAEGEQVLLPEVPAGQFVRRAGSDIAAGAHALAAGTRLGPAQLGLLAALGIGTVPVRRRIRVAVLSTGDELARPGETLRPGQIYDANSTLLASALTEAGAEASVLAPLPDDPTGLRGALGRLEGFDLLISTGGISKGAFEVIKQGLAGAAEFPQLAMQPGGPQAIGSLQPDSAHGGPANVEPAHGGPAHIESAGLSSGADIGSLPFLGFPGNPVSTLISFEMFLRPLLAGPRHRVFARISAGTASPAAKHQIRRARFSAGSVELVGGPGSHLLHAMAQANALVHLPVGLADVGAGEEVEVWLL